MKKLFFIALLFCTSAVMAQNISQSPANDTVYVEKVLVKNQLINARTNKVMRKWWTKKKVKCGYIINQGDGWFLINGKRMLANNFAYSHNDTIAKK